MYGIAVEPASSNSSETAESQPENEAQAATSAPSIVRPICPLCGEDMAGRKTHGQGKNRVCWTCKFVDRRDV